MVSYSKLYVTPDEIREYLGVDEDKYPDSLLINLILEKQEFVDRITNTTWNGRLKRAREMHDITRYKGGWLCIISDAEVLTPDRGWVKVTEIKEGDRIYAVDLRSMKIVETKVRVVQKGVRNDKVVKIGEMLISSEQNVPVSVDGERFAIVSAERVYNDKILKVFIADEDGRLKDIVRPNIEVVDVDNLEFIGVGLEKYHVFVARRNGMIMYLANWGAGIPIHLGHPYVKKVEHLYVQWAAKNEDWVQSRNEGRNFGSYWLDYQTGILYIQTWALYQGGKEIKIQYVYGREDLPWEIKEITKLLVVRDLLVNERRLFALAEGAQGVSWSEYLKYLDERIEMLSEQYRSIKPGYVVTYEMGELSDDEAQAVWDEWRNNEFAW